MHATRNAAAVSRRNLLAGMSAGALGLGMCAVARADQVVSSGCPETWDEEVDVVVIGFGAAGVAAATRAQDLGADVLVLEKMDEAQAGGDTTCFSGVLWARDDPDQIKQFSSHTISDANAQTMSAHVKEALDDFMNWPDVEMDGASIVGGAPAFYAALAAECKDRGIRVMYETPATGLVCDHETGEIRGVRAERGGSPIAVKARKGVVLASGSYAANYDLVRSWHHPGMVLSTVGGIANTGDGHIMAYKAGARPAHINDLALEWAGFALTRASQDLGCGVIFNYSGALTNNGTSDAKLFVNAAGERFANEEAALGHCRNTASLHSIDRRGDLNVDEPGYKNLPMFLITDSKTIEAGPLVPNQGTGWRIKHGVYTWSDDNQAELDHGWLVKADTIEELAAQLTSHDYISGAEVTVPAEALAQTIEAYNAGCASGEDAFGRGSLAPIDTPPYYAAEMNMCTLYSIGGLDGDEHARVLDWENAPIARLYRAGNIGLNSDWFPLGVAACGAQGYMAAEHVVTLEPWDVA